MKKLFFLAALFTATVMNLQAAEAVSYLYPEYYYSDLPELGIKGWKTGSCTNYTVVADVEPEEGAIIWGEEDEDTWYVVNGELTLSYPVYCKGQVHLILTDGAKLTVNGTDFVFAGIQISNEDYSLTIYGQANQTGQLIATGGDNTAGIGGNNGDGGHAYNITINGGKVTAAGGESAAGIGGRMGCTNMTINGGTVNATGGSGAAGIGSGESAQGTFITINGGTVTATGGNGAAGIGGGKESQFRQIYINGGTITANGGNGASGIGSGASGDDAQDILVNPSLILKAGDSANPTEEIAPERSETDDISGDLAGKQYATVGTQVITGVSLTGFNAAYDGQNHSVQVSGTQTGDVISYSTDSTIWAAANPSFKNVVDTLIYVRVHRAKHQDWGGKATITITARAITMTSASDSKQFDGDPLTNATITFSGDGFVGQDTVSCTVTGSQTAVGTSPNYFTYTFSGSSEDNYSFTKVEGTLEVTAAPGPVVETYGRKLKVAGNYGTICLAKKFTSMEGVEGLYVPASKDASKLYCEEVDINEVEAGKAYIFKAEAGKDTITFVLDGEAVPAAVVEEGDYMIGWLAADSTLTAESDYYGLSGNTISKLAAGSKIKQNCAVIDLDNVPAATSAPSRRYVAFGINGTNTPTGMVDVNANVNANRKMMVNGQLIIIRDGKKFNAQGHQL